MKEEKIIKAHAKFIRLSPRKARLVVNEVRGMKALDALAVLKLMPQKAAKEIYKVINSACANAEHNLGISKNDLMIKEIRSDQGPTFKRYKPRARGSADTIRRRTTHLSIILVSTTGKKVEKKPTSKPEVKKVELAKTKREPTSTDASIDSGPKQVSQDEEKKESVKEEKKEIVKKKALAKNAKKKDLPTADQPKIEKKTQPKTKPQAKKKFEPKKDHSFMGGIKRFFRRREQ